MRLEGKVVVITGAGSGLGRESALLFSREGASVVVTDIIERRAKDVADLIGERGGRAVALKVDVTVESDVAEAVAAAVRQFGRLDVMYANAGVTVPGQGTVALEDTTEESWTHVHDTNLKGVFFSIKHAARVMKDQGGGTIVVTSSASSLAAYPSFTIYTASKGGVNALVRGAAFDLGKYGIRVNAICPTHGMSVNFGLPADAEVVGRSYEEVSGPWDPTYAPMPLKLRRPPNLLDNAYAALFLASDESAYMSGVCFPTTDGGTLGRVAIQFPEGWELAQQAAFAGDNENP
ncbi:SDR family oxidoreductase [Frankia sp. Cppng1_Ct_nod]|uniref:SDR family NAD(P)-dependent oxidoreductase n=1 Tax=Frankia sp. Cppng1_Ct_nod TaxID=2897162 RepID=UPI001040F804|nr:SDR family oxidoreductase [Frankia sp. Cppng1_Ct_nod]